MPSGVAWSNSLSSLSARLVLFLCNFNGSIELHDIVKVLKFEEIFPVQKSCLCRTVADRGKVPSKPSLIDEEKQWEMRIESEYQFV